jgi:hypothetical protein
MATVRWPLTPICAAGSIAGSAALLTATALAATPLVFTVRTTQGPTATHPHAPPGGIGDTFVSSLELINLTPQLGKAARATIGTMQFTYTIRKQCTSFAKTCIATADFETVTTLPGGTVVANGKALSIAQPAITIPVVSGTGRYKGVRGTVKISPSSTKLSTFKLTLP